MPQYEETRRTGMCERASEMSLGRDTEEFIAQPVNLQAAWLAARFTMGAAHARVIAEHAFARRSQR